MNRADLLRALPWTAEQDAVLLANRHEIESVLARLASRVGPTRTPSGARKRLRRLLERGDMTSGSAWAPDERALLEKLYPTTSDPDLVQELKKAGFVRSIEAIKRARQRYGYLRERKNELQEQQPGWSPLPGDFEVRDAKFVRMVLEEAYRLRLYKREAA